MVDRFGRPNARNLQCAKRIATKHASVVGYLNGIPVVPGDALDNSLGDPAPPPVGRVHDLQLVSCAANAVEHGRLSTGISNAYSGVN